MVVKHSQDEKHGYQSVQEHPTERDNANLATSCFVSDTRTVGVECRRLEFSKFANNSERTEQGKARFGPSTQEFANVPQYNHIVPVYANMTYVSVNNECSVMTEHDRPVFVARRTNSFDSTDGQNSPRNSIKYETEYECMSSPECISNSSSNRSSNASSFYGNISPDTLSLASFAGRLNFGRFSCGSKRSSQSSSASSQDSGTQSWGKIRDSCDLSDAFVSSIRRGSGDHVYENARPFTPDNSMRCSRAESSHMEVTDKDDDGLPPPLPTRKNQQPVSNPTKEEPEMILPYKIVDLDELQRSLGDIEPYYVHNGPDETERDFYIGVPPDPTEKDVEENGGRVDEGSDFRPVLPPKKRPLHQSKSDSYFNKTESPKDRPTPLPRQNVILCDLADAHDVTVQQAQTDESNNLGERSMSTSGHMSRRKSPPNGHGSKNRRSSTSPHGHIRPARSAPPPPPRGSGSPGERVISNRPVSEMYPQSNSIKLNPSAALKRSNTVSLLQSPFNRRTVNNVSEEKATNVNSVQNVNIPTTASSANGLVDEKTKEDATKASKKGAFLKKALSNLKIPGTKKAAKKELTIGPPTDFTSLCQITDYSKQGNASILATEENAGELDPESDASLVVREHTSEKDEPNDDEWSLAINGKDEPMEQLSFHPEFTELPIVDCHEPGEQFYYNFPIPTSLPDGKEKSTKPKKPPRSGYLQPSLSKLTMEREHEISLNKLPELGPLPTPPEKLSQEGTPIEPPPTSLDVTSNKNKSAEVSPEEHIYMVTTPDSDDPKENNFKVDKPSRKPKPDVPSRPNTLKLKPKVPNRPVFLTSDKPTAIPRSLTLDSATIQKSLESSGGRKNERRHSTPLEEAAALSRSCDTLDDDIPRDTYVTDMYLVVLKDILRCWKNMLRKPTISLAGACWEDFEIVEFETPPTISEVQGSVSLPVRLRKEVTNLKTNNCCGQYIAKIKCESLSNGSEKSPFDQDYSVCTSLEPHENVARVLSYFRGEIESSRVGMGDSNSPLHTTISISDQVPFQTCAEYVACSKGTHSKDPLTYEKTVCMLLLQCLKGIKHLHDSGFSHGNINLNNLFLIKHYDDFQLLIGNFEKSQPLAKDWRASALYSKIDDSPMEPTGQKDDFSAVSDIVTAMLHQDMNGNGTHDSKANYSSLSKHLRKASERLRDRSASPDQVVCFLQALLWGPFKLDENIVIVSESRMKQWIDRQRGEFIARLAMDEALARTVGKDSRKFSMEDLLLCEYLTTATPNSLVRTEKCWFLPT